MWGCTHKSRRNNTTQLVYTNYTRRKLHLILSTVEGVGLLRLGVEWRVVSLSYERDEKEERKSEGIV